MSALKSFKLMTLLVLGASLLPSARAQDATRPWPEALKHRNARYAVCERVQDERGDAKEAVLRDLVLQRALDPMGDREEQRRALASRKVPPRATVHARVTRALDARDDGEQRFVAKLPSKERRHAELRRFRDLAGDQHELAAFRRDLIRFGPLWGEPVVHAEGKLDEGVDRYFDDRGEAIRRDDGTTDQDRERWTERREEIQDERAIFGNEERADERAAERAAEKAAEQAEKDEDRAADKAEEKDEDQADKDAERDLERQLDKGDLDSDRDTERQIQREDEQSALD